MVCTCGMRRSSRATLFLCDGCVDSHSGTWGFPVSWSLISICCQNTGPARTSAHAWNGHTHTHTIIWKTLTHKCTFARARMKIQMDLMSLSIKFSLATVPPSALHADYRFWHLQSTIFANELYYRLILSKRFPAILHSTYIKLGNWQKTKTEDTMSDEKQLRTTFLRFYPFVRTKLQKCPSLHFKLYSILNNHLKASFIRQWH